MADLAPGSTIGFVGLGRMGLPMVRGLVDAGFVVRAYDSDREARRRCRETTGADVMETLHELALPSEDAVVLMLPSTDAVEGVLLGEGLMAMLSVGTIVIDMGSSEPVSTRHLAELAGARQLRYADAPVSGGVRGAETGSLTVMVGGAPEDIAACMALFNVVGTHVLVAGEVGAGHAIKALNNLLSATSLIISAEVLSIGRGWGLDPRILLEIINVSSGRSASTEYKLPRFVLTEEFASGFAMSLMIKDVRTAVALGDRAGVSSLLSRDVLGLWERAQDDLPAGADHTEIARWVAERIQDSADTTTGKLHGDAQHG